VTASAETLEKLEALVWDYQQACEAGTDEQISAADIAFHETIARAAHNQTLIELLQMLSDWTQLFIQFIKHNKTSAAPSQGHRRILDAIRAGNKEDAAAAMRQHLLNGKQSVIRRLREQLEPTASEVPLDFPNAW
ncbi:MAG: FadR family transcriptional regulator, partial [Chloroflexi bacterium]